MKMKLWLTGTLALSLGAVGCSEPPKPEEVADVTAKRSGQMVRGVGSSLRMMSKMSSLNGLGEAASVFTDSFSGVPVTGSPDCGTPGTPPCTSTPMPDAPDAVTSEAQAALVEKYLRERIFTEANVENTDGGFTVFRIMGDDLCSDGSTVPDPKCVQAVDQAELRIRASHRGNGGMDLALLVGPSRAEPVTLSFSDIRAAMTLDLVGIKDAVRFLDAESAKQLPRVMIGRVELSLTSRGSQDMTFQTSFLDPLRVEWDGTDGAYVFTTARAPAMLELTAAPRDGDNWVKFALNLGPTEFRSPYAGSAAQFSGKQWVMSLSGLSYVMDVFEHGTEVVVAHIGLGEAQSYVSLGDQKLFTADLNALSGRHFDLSITQGDDGLPVVSVKPEFDLSLGFALAALEADPSYEVPSYYEDDTYRVRLSGGSAPSLRPVRANATTGFPGGLRVVTGELSLSAKAAQVTVPAGKCLVGRDTAPEGSHPLFGYLEARDCQ